MAEALSQPMPLLAPIHHIIRLTLEAVTPLSIGSGEGSDDLDTPLFRDWNGLPCLSGAGVAGVLRSQWRCLYHAAGLRDLFGEESGDVEDGASSRLCVSFGLAQDSSGTTYPRLVALADDPVLNLLLKAAPITRDSVAINVWGVADEHAKFERALVPVGTRFSLDLSIDGEVADAAADAALLLRVAALIEEPDTRFGGAARRGLGRLKIVREGSGQAAINRTGSKGREAWIAFRKLKPHEHPDALGGSPGFEALPQVLARVGGAISGQLTLNAQGYWRMGQGTVPLTDPGKKRHRMPLVEPIISWDQNSVATIDDQTITPVVAAGIKGGLAHRAEFHLRRMRESKAEGRLMDELFGSVATKGGGRAGRVFIDDTCVTTTAGLRTRNSIDRHTGGGRDGKLFTEEGLWHGDFLVDLAVRADGVEPDVLRAFGWALADLLEGRLAIGAGEAIGDGVMKGTVKWTVPGDSGTATRSRRETQTLVEAAAPQSVEVVQ